MPLHRLAAIGRIAAVQNAGGANWIAIDQHQRVGRRNGEPISQRSTSPRKPPQLGQRIGVEIVFGGHNRFVGHQARRVGGIERPPQRFFVGVGQMLGAGLPAVAAAVQAARH